VDDFYAAFPLGRKTLTRMRSVKTGGHYQILNRREDREIVFRDDEDRAAFVDTIKRLLRPDLFKDSRGRPLQSFADRITLLAFCVLETHYHLVVQAHDEAAVEEFMHRLMTSYTKRFNARHNREGPLFDQPYQCVPVESRRHLKNLIPYVNANVDDAIEYSYSSHRIYVEHELGNMHPWCSVGEGMKLYGAVAIYLRWYDAAVTRRKAREDARRRLRRPW
jgi:REP element-mobilizing transposase RayT